VKIALLGATGTIGQRILSEAVKRGHQVTAVVRDPARVQGVSAVRGDALDSASIAQAVKGNDVAISAVGPRQGEDVELVPKAAHALVDGVKQAGVARLMIVGGAGSLEVAPGVQLVDTPQFPAAWKEIAIAHRDALAVYRDADLDWTYFSPAIFIQPGERTGRYRVGGDQVLADEKGESRISAEDYAVAMLDEVENPKLQRRRVTIAY
jgi:putative NADH-flavin reductase